MTAPMSSVWATGTEILGLTWIGLFTCKSYSVALVFPQGPYFVPVEVVTSIPFTAVTPDQCLTRTTVFPSLRYISSTVPISSPKLEIQVPPNWSCKLKQMQICRGTTTSHVVPAKINQPRGQPRFRSTKMRQKYKIFPCCFAFLFMLGTFQFSSPVYVCVVVEPDSDP